MLFSLKRFTAIEKRVKVLGEHNIGNHNNHDFFDFDRNAVEDVKWLLTQLKNLQMCLDQSDMELQKAIEQKETYELIIERKARQSNILLAENVSLKNDVKYLTETLKSIERISTQGQKHNADLQQINDKCNEALEGI